MKSPFRKVNRKEMKSKNGGKQLNLFFNLIKLYLKYKYCSKAARDPSWKSTSLLGFIFCFTERVHITCSVSSWLKLSKSVLLSRVAWISFAFEKSSSVLTIVINNSSMGLKLTFYSIHYNGYQFKCPSTRYPDVSMWYGPYDIDPIIYDPISYDPISYDPISYGPYPIQIIQNWVWSCYIEILWFYVRVRV